MGQPTETPELKNNIWRYRTGHSHNAYFKWNLKNWHKLQLDFYFIQHFFICYDSHKLHFINNSSSESWKSEDPFMWTTGLIKVGLVSLFTVPLKDFTLIERIRKAPPSIIPLYLYTHKEGQNVCWTYAQLT